MRRFFSSLSGQILIGLIAGLIAGPYLGKSAAPLGEISKLLIQLVKLVATPLLFFAILHAILKAEVTWKSGTRMITIAMINATIALGIGIGISNLLQPGKHLELTQIGAAAAQGGQPAAFGQKLDLVKTLQSYVPSNLIQPWLENNIIPIVLIALLLGFGLRSVRSRQIARAEALYRPIEDAVETLYQVMETVLAWVVRLTPLAVFAAIAKATGENGYAPLKGLAYYIAAGILGMLIHICFTHHAWIKFYARMSLKRFWSEAKEPVIYSIGANSSLATLPLTLRALDRLGVSKSASALGACVGTNLNNDGIILYEGMAVLFVAQAHGIDLSIGQQVMAALTCLIAAMGVAGVPEAGFISLSIILATVGLPLESLPLLVAVDWIIARARSATNVLSDMVVSIGIDREAPAPLPVKSPKLAAAENSSVS